MSTESLSICVIGAGVAGLSCSINLLRTGKRLGKHIEVQLYEKRDGCGGTWSTNAVYPGLITNNSWIAMLIEDESSEMYKMFQDKPEVYGAGPGKFRATGPAMTVHLKQVEKKCVSLGTEIHYNTEVTSVTKHTSGGWLVSIIQNGQPSSRRFDKLVVAAGSFSTASVPPCAEELWNEVLPDKTVPAIDEAQEFIVVGASKSAMDAAERFALTNRKVTLVVKNAPYLAPPSFHDKHGNPADAQGAVASRLMTGFSPYYKDPITGMISSGGWFCSFFRYFMHSTWLGGFLQRFFDAKVTSILAEFNQWTASPANAAMKPETPLTWLEASTYPGPEHLPNLIKEGKVIPLRGAAVGLRKSKKDSKAFDMDVQMNDGSKVTIQANVVVFGTGWKTGEHRFFDRALSNELGQPHRYLHAQDRPEREGLFEELDIKCLDRLLDQSRTLRNVPPEWSLPTYGARTAGLDPTLQIAPFRLYRLMVPLSHLNLRDVVFPGIATNKANTVLADVQGHWIADYLLDNLPTPLPRYSKAAEEISMHVVWSRKLFGPAQGSIASWLGVQWFEYGGRLCRDMGITADDRGLTGVVDSSAFKVEQKRIERDLQRYGSSLKLANGHP